MAHEFKTDTLEDIKNRDIYNLEVWLLKKGRKTKKFYDLEEANQFVGVRLQQMLTSLGVPLESRDADLIELRMQTGNIKVENRVYTESADEWRSGIYIYKNNEIAGFIGYPIYDEYDVDIGQREYTVLCTEKI